jgi:hypothetical protein
MTDALFDFDEKENDRYSKKIPKIQYVPKMDVPPSAIALYNSEKYQKFVDEINNEKLPNDVKNFLLLSATRFIVFDYAKIAEFYCHQDEKVQNIMEKLGLVIIDFDDAIENGFVELNNEMRSLYETKE